jgi:hypothetical protein
VWIVFQFYFSVFVSEIYRDHSYEFSRHFHSMVSKCLRKDAHARPNVKKLLEHKFFKQARDKAYIIEKIVKRLPPKKRDPNRKPLNLLALRHPGSQSGATEGKQIEDEREKPVSIGSWVFDKGEFEALKLKALEEKEAQGAAGSRNQSVQDSYGDGVESVGAARRSANYLTLPLGAAQLPNGRSPSNAVPSSGSDESSEHESDEDAAHRHALPDFSDPSGEPPNQAALGISASPVHSPKTPTMPNQAVSQQLSAENASSSASAAGGHLHPSPSGSPHLGRAETIEHQEGRFHVSEDADEGEEAGYEENNQEQHQQQQQEPAYYDSNPPQEEFVQCRFTEAPDVGAAAEFAGGGFHNDAAEEEEQQQQQHPAPSSPHSPHSPHAEHHVGRFAVTEDDQEE